VSDETHIEDRTILAALEALGKGVDTSGQIPVSGLDESADTFTRLYLETLGLLPYALEPIVPSPELEAKILDAIRGEETQGVVEQIVEPLAEPASSAAPEPAAPSAPVASMPPKEPTGPIRPRLIPMPPSAGRAGSARRRWPLALAAVLALAMAGLSGWLALEVRQSQSTIADLQREVESLRERAKAANAEAAQARLDVLSLKEKFSLVTSPAVEVSPLRPDEASPLQPDASGILFVAADRQHWYLSMHNLAPAQGQKAYCLWFINDSGPILGGAFNSQPGTPIELSAKRMPAGTKDVRVTLEDSARVVQPAGQLVLKVTASYKL